jgi:DNA-binding transcriptional MerR regulator
MALETKRLYSIGDLVRETGIPQRSLTALLEHHGDAVPSLMDGDRRRYTPEAVSVLQRFWRSYKRGIKEEKVANTWHAETLDTLLKSSEGLAEVAATLRKVQSELRRHPPQRIFYINAFPGEGLQPARAIAVHVETQGSRSRATLMEADLEAYGEDDKTAVMHLREVIIRAFLRLRQERSEDEAEQFSVLSSLIK